MAKFVSRKKQRTTKILIIALAALAVVAVVGLLALLLFTPRENTDDTSIKYLRVTQLPKTVYFVGEVASYDGLVIYAKLSNGETQRINLDECTITGFNAEKATDSQTIKIRYKGFTCSYEIVIKDAPQTFVSLQSISLKTLPDKLTYKLDEYIEVAGGVILCTYSDGTTKEVELLYRNIKEWYPDEVGEYVVTVIYQDEAGRKTTTFTVTITE